MRGSDALLTDFNAVLAHLSADHAVFSPVKLRTRVPFSECRDAVTESEYNRVH